MRASHAVCVTILAAGGFAIVASLAACPEGGCSSVCDDNVVVSTDVSVTPEALSGASVTFCRNQVCASGTLGSVSPDYNPDVTFAASSYQVVIETLLQADGSTLVTFEYLSGGTIGGDSGYADGDTYAVKIIDATGTTLIDATRAVTYATSSAGCGSYLCHDLLLEL